MSLPVVPRKLAPSLGNKEYDPQGAITNCAGSSPLGTTVAMPIHLHPLRQLVTVGKSTELAVMHLLRGLYLFAMAHGFCISAAQTAGKDNSPVHALSRNQHSSFLTQVPETPAEQAIIPPELLKLLLAEQPPDRLSADWRKLMTTILGPAAQNPHPRHTNQAKSTT